MAPKIPSVISCSSTALLEYELSEVRAGLEIMETEDSWDKILNALLRLNAIAIGSAADYPSQLIAACKGFVRPLINSLTSERSRLSGAATDVLTSLATYLQRTFEALIPHFVPTLLTLAARSNKIFIARAKACLLAIVENCQSPAILPLLRHAISDKSVALRLTVVELVVACLNCFNPPDLEAPNRPEDIEIVIRATARDPSADIRKSSRKAFEAYKILFPSRVDAFVAPLTPTMKKYLDVKSAAANQRKPLLSSSTSAPSIPSLSQSADTLSRSQPIVQGHAKSASTSAAVSTTTTFTRVDKPSRSASSKPPSAGNAPALDSVLMPPPPPPEKKSSSGPVRPPPSMRQAIAAAAAAPTRPRLGRLASRPNLQTSGSMASDVTKSQPTSSRGGAQRPEKAPTPPSISPTLDAAQSAPPPTTEEPPRVRSTTGPRRVPKSEAVPVTTSAPSGPPASSRKQVESLKETTKEKGKDKEKPTFATSTSSSTSTHTDVHARSRPPSRLASSTTSPTGEEEALMRRNERTEKERIKEKEREGTETRAEAFRPRPASRMEETHKRTDSKDHELHPRPASRVDDRQPVFRPPSRTKPVFTRPPSRMEKAQERAESRAEPGVPERPRKKRPVDQPPVQTQPQQAPEPDAEAQARVLAKEERRRRRAERAAEAAQATEALTRAPSKKGKERIDQEVPSKKRRGEAEEGEARRRKHREVHPSQDLVNPGESTAPGKIIQQGSEERQALASKDVPLCPESSAGSKTNGNDGSEGSSKGPINVEGGSSTKEEVSAPEKTSEPCTPAKAKEAQSSRFGGVRPLAIHKASASNSPVESNADAVDTDASFVPLPSSPPEPVVPETPAPLRQALAARRNQVPATPISKLLVSIQRGFETHQNAIEEEDEGELLSQGVQPLQASSSEPEAVVAEERVVKGDDHRRHHSHENKAKTEDANPFFVDTRPRKHKSESSKARGHNGRKEHNEARVPFMRRAENR
ncbi:hypothetical protein A7U60_g5501 [Sanghuangporus baumii]|uniref:TOG domain-containing protein n=1 Tax=Sanghuangporus baumii TaxID=108892 RepID=A0A9Q5N7Z5_SANBA|nr:hypothetical protein A7U60_g5501 [Sanghuangporus baumii]